MGLLVLRLEKPGQTGQVAQPGKPATVPGSGAAVVGRQDALPSFTQLLVHGEGIKVGGYSCGPSHQRQVGLQGDRVTGTCPTQGSEGSHWSAVGAPTVPGIRARAHVFSLLQR